MTDRNNGSSKRKTLLALLAGVAVLIAILFAGIHGIQEEAHMKELKQTEQHQEMVDVINENKHLIKDIYPKATTITIDYDECEFSPMGALFVYGYINNDKKLSFTVQLAQSSGKIQVSGTVDSPGLEKYR